MLSAEDAAVNADSSEDHEQDSNVQSDDEDDWTAEESFPFLDLPAELQLKIFASVDDVLSILALRRTCRYMNDTYLRNKSAILASARDAVIRPILDHYIFLINYAIPSSEIQWPPEGGWPQLAGHTTESSGKSELVLEVLRHLPYFANTATTCSRDTLNLIDYKCYVVDWRDWTPGKDHPDQWLERVYREHHQDCQDEDMDYLGLWEDYHYSYDDDDDSAEDHEKEDDGGSDDDSDDAAAAEHGTHGGDSVSLPTKFRLPKLLGYQNLICIAAGWESGNVTLYLDTVYGVVHECIQGYSCEAFFTQDYFEQKQQKYKDCKEILIRGWHGPQSRDSDQWQAPRGDDFPEYTGLEGGEDEPDLPSQDFGAELDFVWVRHLLKSHGWPSKDWRMAEAQQAIRAYRMKREAQAP